MRAMLISFAMLLVLGRVAVGEELPAPADAPAAVEPIAGGGVSTVQGSGRGTRCCTSYGTMTELAFLAGIAALVYLIAGLLQKRHEWKPLVVGLFALGFGVLGMLSTLIGGLDIILQKSGETNPADICEAAAFAMYPLITGLAVALAGGLFTVILRWRNDRFRAEQAEVEAEETEEG